MMFTGQSSGLGWRPERITQRFEPWVVEPAGLVERFSGPGLAASDEVRGTIASVVLPGLVVDLDQVFA